MPRHMGNRVAMLQVLAQAGQLDVLSVFKRVSLQTLEFNANRVIVAVVPPSVAGLSCVPSPVLGADKLPQASIASNIKVGGHFQVPDLPEVRVGIPVQLVGKQGLDLVTSILSGRQADGVDHQQVDACALRPGAEVGGNQGLRRSIPAVVPNGIGWRVLIRHDHRRRGRVG